MVRILKSLSAVQHFANKSFATAIWLEDGREIIEIAETDARIHELIVLAQRNRSDKCEHGRTTGNVDGSATCHDCGGILPEDLREDQLPYRTQLARKLCRHRHQNPDDTRVDLNGDYKLADEILTAELKRGRRK